MLDKQKEKTGLASLQQMHRNTVITSRPHTHSAHFAGILALPPIPHAGNRKIKQPASLSGLGRLCAEMLMVLGGQQAIPGTRHRPGPSPGCTTHDSAKKAAASGRSALALSRAPARAVCMARRL
jgi:hypothetical protein